MQKVTPIHLSWYYRKMSLGSISRVGVCVTVAFAVCLQPGCRKKRKAESGLAAAAVIGPALLERSSVPSPDAEKCGQCHVQIVKQWRSSHHALANRLVDASADATAFEPARTFSVGSFRTRVEAVDGHPRIEQGKEGADPDGHMPEAVLGIDPLVQYLVPFPGGRLQVVDMAHDPRSNEWFNVFGDEDRQSHEWGFWKNRGNNWNSQCAFCHMTGFRKNYDIKTDSYASTWDAMGISCAQCHGPMTGHLAAPDEPVEAEKKTPRQIMDNCASCHSRRTELTGNFQPGDIFDDHFALLFAHRPDDYYPDGQVLEENFTYGSFMMSRMAHKGITCLDCHNPHSADLTIPVQNNLLCLSCHQAPGQREAILIDPDVHGHHAQGSRGSACIECHMPITVYMQRDPRRDHSFSSPDPRMTKEFGIPNACNRCHADESVDWAIDWSEKWYGTNLVDGIARRRTRAVARAQAGDGKAVDDVLSLIDTEEITYRRATLITLLQPWAGRDKVASVLEQALRDPNPWIRTAAVNALAPIASRQASILPLRKDNARAVRIAAGQATLSSGNQGSRAYREVLAYLNGIADQPAGAVGQAELAMADDRDADAETWIQKAVDWDPSANPYYVQGRVQHALGKLNEAEASMTEAARLDPENADYTYALALLYAESGKQKEAHEALVKTIQLDPSFGRAWYNLGLAYAQEERLDQAIAALHNAEKRMPESPDAAYARATVHFRKQEWKLARAAAEKALTIAPGHAQAAALLAGLPKE